MKKKNIILISIDSLRADHLSSLGYDKKITPNLDEIAKNGVLFTQAFSYGSTTFTSIPTLLTSSPVIPYFYSVFNMKKRIMNIEERLKIYKDVIRKFFEIKPTIAGVLKQHGYETAAFHSNPYLSRFYGYGIDYSHFYDSFDDYGPIKKIAERFKILLASSKLDRLAMRLYFMICWNDIPYERAEIINKKAISWLLEAKPDLFFIWLHYMDTHVPYKPPKRFHPNINSLRMSNLNRKLLGNDNLSDRELNQLIELYDGSINYLDETLKSLFETLDDLEILDDTIVIITADHGEEFKDHGGILHNETKLYDELLHVPLIIYNSDYSNITIDEPVSLIDVFPTILDLLNLETGKEISGKSLIPIIKGEKNLGIMSQGIGNIDSDSNLKLIMAYRTKQWKYIMDNLKNHEELYNLIDDKNEKNNLSQSNEKITKKFKSIILKNISSQSKFTNKEIEKGEIKEKIRKLRLLDKKK